MAEGAWLAAQGEAFRSELLQRSFLKHYKRGEAVFHFGDPLGGIYGLVEGCVTISTSPEDSLPRMFHVGVPGTWTGEGCYLSGQLRRLELRALIDTWMMHTPLDVMEQMTAANPNVSRVFAQILSHNVDVMIRVIHDLQMPNSLRRVASVLQRMAWWGEVEIPISQTELGGMSNVSRQQVSIAIGEFAKRGWLSVGYRAITIHDAAALRAFAEED